MRASTCLIQSACICWGFAESYGGRYLLLFIFLDKYSFASSSLKLKCQPSLSVEALQGGKAGVQGRQKFLLAVQALFMHVIVVTPHFNQLQCNGPGGAGVGNLAGRHRWRMGFDSKRILLLCSMRREWDGCRIR